MYFKMLFLKLFIICIIHQSAQQNLETSVPDNSSLYQRGSPSQISQSNIVFELPDLVVPIQNEFENIQIEAFKVLGNDKILQENNSSKYDQLTWVSIGHPRLIQRSLRSEQKPSIFHFTPSSIYTYVEMLTETQKALFVNSVKFKYNINTIQPSQIVNLILSKFECKIDFYNTFGNRFTLNGKVSNFRDFPLRMDFLLPPNSIERKFFIELINSTTELNLQFNCEIGSQGKQRKINTFTINTEVMNQLDLVDKLFGLADEKFVSRQQMTSLASDLYTNMDILEEYDMPEFKFKETFVDDFIKLTATSVFAHQNIYSILDKLSLYSINFADDLKPDVIKKEASKILKVETLHNKSRIIVYKEGLESLKVAGKMSYEASGSGGDFLGIFSVDASVKVAAEFSSDWLSHNKKLDDQLNEINKVSISDVQWEFEGEKIIPKSINVAKIIKSKFSQTLVFNRVRQEYFTAPFVRQFSLYTPRSLSELSYIETIKTTLNEINYQYNNLNVKLKHKIKCFSVGNNKMYEFPFANFSGPGDRYFYDEIEFGTQFDLPPNVTISIAGFDINKGPRISISIESVSLNKFKIKMWTWSNTEVYRVAVSWSAFGCIIPTPTPILDIYRKHACESFQLEINCPSDHFIVIKEAFYGRRDYGICSCAACSNTNCVSYPTPLLISLCQGKQSCIVKSENSLFGDPCQATPKYLEVTYNCYPYN